MKDKKQELNVRMIPTSQLKISDFNVRKEHDDTDKITELAKSIDEQGILQPLLVRPENGNYGIIIGSRRYSAAKKLHLKELPANIKELPDTESLEVSLIENLQRNDLEPIETTQAMVRLNQTLSTRDLADKIGKSQGYIMDMITVEKLLFKLDQSGVKVRMYPTGDETARKKAIPLYHAIMVSKTFKKTNVRKVLETEPNKDLEVATALCDLTQKEAELVTDVYSEDPVRNSNIDGLIQLMRQGLLRRNMKRTSYKGERGEKGIDVAKYERGINEHSGELWHYLTNMGMPEPTDDVQVDYIMKSRDFRKFLVSELDPMRRAGIHRRLNHLSAVIEEMMDEIERLDKQE